MDLLPRNILRDFGTTFSENVVRAVRIVAFRVHYRAFEARGGNDSRNKVLRCESDHAKLSSKNVNNAYQNDG